MGFPGGAVLELARLRRARRRLGSPTCSVTRLRPCGCARNAIARPLRLARFPLGRLGIFWQDRLSGRHWLNRNNAGFFECPLSRGGLLRGHRTLLKTTVRAPNSASRVETRNFPALFFFGQWYALAIAYYYKGG